MKFLHKKLKLKCYLNFFQNYFRIFRSRMASFSSIYFGMKHPVNCFLGGIKKDRRIKLFGFWQIEHSVADWPMNEQIDRQRQTDLEENKKKKALCHLGAHFGQKSFPHLPLVIGVRMDDVAHRTQASFQKENEEILLLVPLDSDDFGNVGMIVKTAMNFGAFHQSIQLFVSIYLRYLMNQNFLNIKITPPGIFCCSRKC